VNTLFSDLYKYLRYEIIRKDDENVLPAADLDLAIEYILTFEFGDGFAIVDTPDGKSIAPELNKNQKQRLILKTALSILIPEDAFSFTTQTLSKTIAGLPGLEEQKEDLKKRIISVENTEGSEVPSCADDEFGQYINQGTRLLDTITKAQTNG